MEASMANDHAKIQVSKLSRRFIVAGAAALPALTMPAMAMSEPDAELIKLAETYERIFRIRAPLAADYNERWGDALLEASERVANLSGPERSKVYDVEVERLWVESGSEKAHEKVEPLDDQINELAVKILEIPPHTAAGLRARVALVAEAYPDLWDAPLEDLDWDKRMVRYLIEAVCSLGEFALPTETMGLAVQS
jgi:hypothetical protein